MSTSIPQTPAPNAMPLNTSLSVSLSDALLNASPSMRKRPAEETLQAQPPKVCILQSEDFRVSLWQKEVRSLEEKIEELQEELRQARTTAEADRQHLLVERDMAEARARSSDQELKHSQQSYQIARADVEGLKQQLEFAKTAETRARSETYRLFFKFCDMMARNVELSKENINFQGQLRIIHNSLKSLVTQTEEYAKRILNIDIVGSSSSENADSDLGRSGSTTSVAMEEASAGSSSSDLGRSGLTTSVAMEEVMSNDACVEVNKDKRGQKEQKVNDYQEGEEDENEDYCDCDNQEGEEDYCDCYENREVGSGN
ncbi:hypothetical protein VKT23_015084 [Stygiomarasmius scandens]|uniref:Uncharacterized protein n=1 Tax=Marasmiellus scandens TaxID=2682957 RepID=A0ABR1J353_9AGAR